MHKINISPRSRRRAARRRDGNPHAFTRVDARKTALLVIDMQIFSVEAGPDAQVPVAQEIVPNINHLASKLRAAGGQVVWIATTFDENTSENWSVMMHELFSGDRRETMLENLQKGSRGHSLWPELITKPEDWSVEKSRFSAFIQGSSDLEQQLRASDIDTLIITGTLTDICCESTARDAMMLNFRTIVITDANAASCDEDHNNSLNTMARVFADVISTEEVIERFTSSQVSKA